jgi:diguanylate cyclase (GGDEF)-like protein/PAS domain S-box-containing protein
MSVTDKFYYKKFFTILQSETAAWIILATSLMFTWLGWSISKYYVEQRANEKFLFEVEDARARIAKRMLEYEQVLRGGIAFLSTKQVLATRKEWRDYVIELKLSDYYPGIQGIGFSLIIPSHALSAHIETIRHEGFPNYQIRPAGSRDIYSSIIYLEPFDWRNQRAFGYDMFAEPIRHAAMAQARDSGQPSVSGKVTLIQETQRDVQPGFLMYLPLYAKNKAVNTIEQRKANLIGYVYSPFRMKDLMHGILGAGQIELGFDIYDGTESQIAENLLYQTNSPDEITVKNAVRAKIATINLPGRIWSVRFYSRPAFDIAVASNQPELIAVGGFIMDILLFIIIWSLADERRRVQAKAEAMTADLRRVNQRLALDAKVFKYAHEGIIITDVNKNILDVNPTFTNLTGYKKEEVVGNTPKILSSKRHSNSFYTEMWSKINHYGYWQGEVWNQHKNGDLYAELLTISTIEDQNGTPTNYVGMFTDITAIKQQQSQLEQMALYDSLTHLPNRVSLAQQMEIDMANTLRNGLMMAVCYLDLDSFKQVNDNYGHDIGDQLLIQVANRLNRDLRPGDSVARLGGDEFVLLLCELHDQHECEVLVKKSLHDISAQYFIANHAITISASIGVTLFPDDEEEADALLRHADQAMYQAKQNGANRFLIFDPAQDRQARAYQNAITQIETALKRNEFVLHYQPKVDMRHGTVLGAEALVRWKHPTRGLLYPNQFLPKIEHTEFAIHLGDWVLNEAMRQLEVWRKLNFKTTVSVNISGQYLQQQEFVERLQVLLQRYRATVEPAQLELEVLETTALDDLEQASCIINACRALGVSVAIDDFGTGYSSLIYLKRLPADILKVDQSFVRDMLRNPEDLAIIEGIIGLSQAVHRKVIAEGVESEEHGTTLLNLGCDLGQGYGIARPMPPEDFFVWAKNYTQHQAWSEAIKTHSKILVSKPGTNGFLNNQSQLLN